MRGFNASGKLNKNEIKDRALLVLYKEVVQEIRSKFPLIGHYLEILYTDTEKILEEIRGYSYDDLLDRDKVLFEKK